MGFGLDGCRLWSSAKNAGESAEIGGDATRIDATLPCDSVRTMSAAKTHDFRDSRAAVVHQLLQNGVRAGGIAARRSRVPSRWEQAFWARFDAQRATLERAA
jgi:hypothetical protein